MLIPTERTQAIAATKAGMDEKTARKYLKSGELPSQSKEGHLGTEFPSHPQRDDQGPFFICIFHQHL